MNAALARRGKGAPSRAKQQGKPVHKKPVPSGKNGKGSNRLVECKVVLHRAPVHLATLLRRGITTMCSKKPGHLKIEQTTIIFKVRPSRARTMAREFEKFAKAGADISVGWWENGQPVLVKPAPKPKGGKVSPKVKEIVKKAFAAKYQQLVERAQQGGKAIPEDYARRYQAIMAGREVESDKVPGEAFMVTNNVKEKFAANVNVGPDGMRRLLSEPGFDAASEQDEYQDDGDSGTEGGEMGGEFDDIMREFFPTAAQKGNIAPRRAPRAPVEIEQDPAPDEEPVSGEEPDGTYAPDAVASWAQATPLEQKAMSNWRGVPASKTANGQPILGGAQLAQMAAQARAQEQQARVQAPRGGTITPRTAPVTKTARPSQQQVPKHQHPSAGLDDEDEDEYEVEGPEEPPQTRPSGAIHGAGVKQKPAPPIPKSRRAPPVSTSPSQARRPAPAPQGESDEVDYEVGEDVQWPYGDHYRSEDDQKLTQLISKNTRRKANDPNNPRLAGKLKVSLGEKADRQYTVEPDRGAGGWAAYRLRPDGARVGIGGGTTASDALRRVQSEERKRAMSLVRADAAAARPVARPSPAPSRSAPSPRPVAARMAPPPRRPTPPEVDEAYREAYREDYQVGDDGDEDDGDDADGDAAYGVDSESDEGSQDGAPEVATAAPVEGLAMWDLRGGPAGWKVRRLGLHQEINATSLTDALQSAWAASKAARVAFGWDGSMGPLGASAPSAAPGPAQAPPKPPGQVVATSALPLSPAAPAPAASGAGDDFEIVVLATNTGRDVSNVDRHVAEVAEEEEGEPMTLAEIDEELAAASAEFEALDKRKGDGLALTQAQVRAWFELRDLVSDLKEARKAALESDSEPADGSDGADARGGEDDADGGEDDPDGDEGDEDGDEGDEDGDGIDEDAVDLSGADDPDENEDEGGLDLEELKLLSDLENEVGGSSEGAEGQ